MESPPPGSFASRRAVFVLLPQEVLISTIRGGISAVAGLVPLFAFATVAMGQSNDELVKEALSAAPETVASDATVMDWEQNVLREGTNGFVCFPTPPNVENGPMCVDEPWQAWAHSWAQKDPDPPPADRVGISYMLQGDSGASNIDPWAEGPTPDNEWVVEGPHLMILVPDPASLEGLPTDPDNGGPYVMWKGTPYAHIMVPVR